MEDYKMPINFVSSLVLTFAFTAFIIFIFGRENSKLNKLSFWNSMCVKIALGLCTAGALFNALTFSNPPWSEVVLNTGLAILFTWASWFHFFHFVKPERKKIKKTKMTKYK